MFISRVYQREFLELTLSSSHYILRFENFINFRGHATSDNDILFRLYVGALFPLSIPTRPGIPSDRQKLLEFNKFSDPACIFRWRGRGRGRGERGRWSSTVNSNHPLATEEKKGPNFLVQSYLENILLYIHYFRCLHLVEKIRNNWIIDALMPLIKFKDGN